MPTISDRAEVKSTKEIRCYKRTQIRSYRTSVLLVGHASTFRTQERRKTPVLPRLPEKQPSFREILLPTSLYERVYPLSCKYKIFTTLDAYYGYWQINITP